MRFPSQFDAAPSREFRESFTAGGPVLYHGPSRERGVSTEMNAKTAPDSADPSIDFRDVTYSLNGSPPRTIVSDVSFAAALDTDDNGDGIADTGLYVSSHGSLRLVARTGTVIPGLGTIAYLGLAPFSPTPVAIGGVINERGQVLFFATLSDGEGVLLVATPSP